MLSHAALVAVTAPTELAFASLSETASSTTSAAALPAAALSASLGVLGALVLILYASIGALKDPDLELKGIRVNVTRLFLGGLAGWALTFLFYEHVFSDAKIQVEALVLPFVAGFSTELVLEVIEHLKQAIRYALGLHDKTPRAG